jgi:hypothetical protein
MRRREFIAGLGSAAALPVVARAQQAAIPVVGFLSTESADDDYKNITVPFLQGLREAGYVEGQTVAIEYRYAENQLDRLPVLAADLVRPWGLPGTINATLRWRKASGTPCLGGSCPCHRRATDPAAFSPHHAADGIQPRCPWHQLTC